jgi:single-stranded DNA-binding protein
MNRWTGTAHLTRDPELAPTSGDTDIGLMRIAVQRAAKTAPGATSSSRRSATRAPAPLDP